MENINRKLAYIAYINKLSPLNDILMYALTTYFSISDC